jgi:para-aminobenzoate synthetase/4-amino-4-deoxychorismate lyase
VTSPQGIYRGELGIGSGIVADSNPEQEWAESKLKSMFFLNPPPNFSIIESLRFENGFSRLSQHLDRMAASAEYFGFTFDEESILDALRTSTRSLNKGLFKVRLLLSPTGEISAETLPFSPAKEPVKVRIAKERTDPEDPFLFHKTTHRPLYGEAEQSAREEGLWDLIFLNNREEVTEGAICNIFVYVDGRWFTPQQSSGILKGVMREKMLSQLNAEERILLLDDLLNAEEVLVTNSVQGALKAELLLSPHAKMQRS